MVAVMLPSRKSGGETVNAAIIRRALTRSLAIFKLKRHRLSFQDRFLYSDSPSPYRHLCPWAMSLRKVEK
jgi:hypothetical protein